MSDRRVELTGFTPKTWVWLHDKFNAEHVVTGKRALGLVAKLRDEPDENFPGGKWATIQHLEARIAAAVDGD